MNAPRRLCLLVVADDPSDVSLLRPAVRQSGFSVELFIVNDCPEALRFLGLQGDRFQRAPRPDLILLDIKMRGLGGLDFLATVKQDERLRAIPVVIVSSSAPEADVRAAYSLGAASYILKPADHHEFTGTINKLCQYWFGRMRLPENSDSCAGTPMGTDE